MGICRTYINDSMHNIKSEITTKNTIIGETLEK